MSSPNFNNITVIGCMFAYLEVFLSAHGSSGSAEHLNHAFLCNVRSVSNKSRLKNSSFSKKLYLPLEFSVPLIA